jgi:hypothetical protein
MGKREERAERGTEIERIGERKRKGKIIHQCCF